MDNRKFIIVDDSNLDKWMELCMGWHKALGWSAEYPPKTEKQRLSSRLILYWHDPGSQLPHDSSVVNATEYHPLPSPMGPAQVVPIVREWLEQVDYGPKPDFDGTAGKGFILFCNDWGFVGSCHAAFMAIQPKWAMYGK